MAMKIHPACEASPLMSPERYEAFKADIEQRGQVQPIMVFKKQILDGRHRQMACDELGIEPHYLRDDDLVEHGGDPWAFVHSTMMRKNHSTEQLAMYAAHWQKHLKPKAKERQGKRNDLKKDNIPAPRPECNGDSRDEAANKFGVGARSVSRAQNVIDHGCPQLQQAVREGRVNLTLAEKIAKSLEGDQQQEAVALAMIADKPEQALKAAIKTPAKEVEFDEEKELDRLTDLLRKTLDKWPKARVNLALNIINCIIPEYKQ